jgi:hypothetical protein
MTRVIDNYNPLRKEVITSAGIQSLSNGAGFAVVILLHSKSTL